MRELVDLQTRPNPTRMEKYRTDAIDKLMKSLQDELDLVESQRKSMVTVPIRQKEREREVQPIEKALQPQEQIPPKISGQRRLSLCWRV